MSDPKYLRKALLGKMTRLQRYALVMLMEECGEVTVACSKALRWGFDSYNPHDTAAGDNLTQIRREISDIREAVDRFEASMVKPVPAKRRSRPSPQETRGRKK